MSTKATIAYSDGYKMDFHLYSECFDDENIYLELVDPITGHETTTAIPIAVWEVIRKRTNLDTSHVNKTDEDIQTEAMTFVETRIAHREAKGESIHDVFGMMIYGSVEDSISTQIAEGIKNMTAEREKQKAMLETIDKLEKQQR